MENIIATKVNITNLLTHDCKNFFNVNAEKSSNSLGESMGSVPRLHRLSQNWLKFSGFVELDELIILVINCYDFDYGLGLK